MACVPTIVPARESGAAEPWKAALESDFWPLMRVALHLLPQAFFRMKGGTIKPTRRSWIEYHECLDLITKVLLARRGRAVAVLLGQREGALRTPCFRRR